MEHQSAQQMGLANIATDIINTIHQKKVKRDIWSNSKWKNIAELENDDVGKAGEQIINSLCQQASVPSDIDGVKTKEVGGGNGDGGGGDGGGGGGYGDG